MKELSSQKEKLRTIFLFLKLKILNFLIRKINIIVNTHVYVPKQEQIAFECFAMCSFIIFQFAIPVKIQRINNILKSRTFFGSLKTEQYCRTKPKGKFVRQITLNLGIDFKKLGRVEIQCTSMFCTKSSKEFRCYFFSRGLSIPQISF